MTQVETTGNEHEWNKKEEEKRSEICISTTKGTDTQKGILCISDNIRRDTVTESAITEIQPRLHVEH